MKTSNKILIILAIFVLIFTAIMIWLFFMFQEVPDTLIACVFGLLTGECGILGWIKTTKTKHEEDVG